MDYKPKEDWFEWWTKMEANMEVFRITSLGDIDTVQRQWATIVQRHGFSQEFSAANRRGFSYM